MSVSKLLKINAAVGFLNLDVINGCPKKRLAAAVAAGEPCNFISVFMHE